MNRTTKSLIAAALIVALGGAAWHLMPRGPQKPTEEKTRETLEDAVGLALKGVELVQGEKGVELWRLKATWAALRQERGVIDVDSPDIVYKVGDAEEPLHVVAPKGEVLDNQTFIRLWDEVVCTYKEYVLTSTLMTYNSTVRRMVFPDGAHIVGPTSQGNATRLSWNLATNIIEGDGGVKVHWSAAPRTAPGNAQQAGEGTGADKSSGHAVPAVQ